MTQRDRILRLLRLRGEQGVNQIDFALPDVVDGGTPILYPARRIHDLKNEGYRFATRRRENQTVDYILLSEPATAQLPPQDTDPAGTTDATNGQASLFSEPVGRSRPESAVTGRRVPA